MRYTDWYEQRHLSRDEFHSRFPYKDEAARPADDGGLAARLDALFVQLIGNPRDYRSSASASRRRT